MVLCTILAVVGFRFRGGCTMCYIFHNALDFDDGKKMRFFFLQKLIKKKQLIAIFQLYFIFMIWSIGIAANGKYTYNGD